MNGMVERICVVGNDDLDVPTLVDERFPLVLRLYLGTRSWL